MFWLMIVTLLVTLHRGEEVELEKTKLPCSGDECWASSVELRTTPLVCYQCRHCNNVTTSDFKMKCEFSACCYVAVVTDFGNEETFMVRGCAPVNRSCIDGCKQIQLEHQLAQPNGTFGYCLTCKGNECNVNKYTPYKLRRVYNEVNCYECRNCNKINASTPTVRCSQPECCYMAVLKDTLDDRDFSVRGCLKQNCSDTCRLVKDQHLQTHAEEMFSYCMTCVDGAGDVCNGHEYSPKLIEEINCFVCEDCKDIKMDTVKMRCGSNCCYSKIVMGKYRRGCVVDLDGGSCEDYCQMDDLCGSCSDNNCNSLRFPIVDSFKCYNCIDCDTVSSNTPKINCITNCCATVVKTVRGVSSSIRNCVGLDGDGCQQYCAYIARSSKIANCSICNGNECNGVPTNQTSLLKRQTPFSCYSCRNSDCNFVSMFTQVYCSNRCCFAEVFRRDDGSVVARRGCARIRSGCPCSGYCEKERKNHAAINPVSARKFYCAVCSSPMCNEQVLDTSFKPRGIPGYYPKTCYSCINCYDVNEDTDTIECPDGCCYTAIWTEFDRRLLVRFCALLEGKRCNDYCGYLKDRLADNSVYGSLHFCRTCCDEKCNSEPPPEYFERIKADPGENTCYHCENCAEIDKAHRVPCPSHCCYSQLKIENDGKRVAERHCAKLFPGTPCHKFCTYAEKLHMRFHPRGFMSYCKACPIGTADTVPNCNQEKLNTAEIGKVDNANKCYECDGCYVVNPNDLKPCSSGCCYTRIETYLGRSTIKRGCIGPDDTPCVNYCDTQDIKMRYTDPAVKMYCRFCKSDECNVVQFEEPTTMKPAMSCYVCTDCDALSVDDDRVVCNSRCCFTTFSKTGMDTFISERGCADLANDEACDTFCDKFDLKTTKHCTFCEEDDCNHINLRPKVELYKKAVKCYECAECSTDDCPASGTEKKDCTLQTDDCKSTCCYTILNVEDHKSYRGCVTDDNDNPCIKTTFEKWFKPIGVVSFKGLAKLCSSASCNSEIYCYECKDCTVVQGGEQCDASFTSKCQPKLCTTKCCYSIKSTTSKTHKGCLKGLTLDEVCTHGKIKKHPPIKIGEMEYFESCSKDKCNTQTPSTFKCYECEKCDKDCDPDGGKCKASDTECSTKCCYLVYSDKSKLHRGCVPKETNQIKCTDNAIKSWFATKNGDTKELHATACYKHLCNDQVVQPELFNFKCYTCESCKQNCEPGGANCQEEKNDCASKCCYLVYSHKSKLHRGCVLEEGTTKIDCTDDKITSWFLSSKKTQANGATKGELNAKACKKHLCNNQVVKPELYVENV